MAQKDLYLVKNSSSTKGSKYGLKKITFEM